MNYRFNGKIFLEGNKAFIEIPFNVWEECNQKGNIPVKVCLNELEFECKLVPKGKGNYYIPVKQEYIKDFDIEKELEISFELISGLTRINNNSPYSLENPIRKIDSIEFVAQNKKGLCGQTIVSMLSGAKMEEVIELMGTQSSMSKVIEALDYFGINHSGKMIYNIKENNTLPKCCIINSKGHLIVFYEGKYYDSYAGILSSFDINNITGFLEILTD
ncbi:DUF1905 domain-containing protein [Clostridium sp. C2-6-12]|uniref:DUF1905 domain-containing protein n=1 Tax=Clostridium sp. C2-6-12 TaxID=2698832 RepID=UPI00136A42C1|nr:DUF1905 domain-containing protein [Clostridium sp. C2-6-12]